jgi:hypothetical protein
MDNEACFPLGVDKRLSDTVLIIFYLFGNRLLGALVSARPVGLILTTSAGECLAPEVINRELTLWTLIHLKLSRHCM